MKRLLYLAVSFFFVANFLGCERDLSTEGISTMRYYPAIKLVGSEEITLNAGDAYVEPGVSASQNGVVLPVTTTITSLYFGATAVNSNVPDTYYVNYTAVSPEGYSTTKSRTVIVNPVSGNFVTSLAGWYSANVKRAPAQGAVSATANLNYILVSELSPNKYGISDGIGGYYAIGRAYGPGYIAKGATFTADIAGNVFTPGPNYTCGAFGGTVVLNSVTIDPATKQIVFVASWDGGPYVFTVTLKQVQL